MRATIEDLEALKELNDELEENHVETEKHLNTEIGELGSWRVLAEMKLTIIDKIMNQLSSEKNRSAELDAMIYDLETTSGQFRELVMGLQRSASYGR